MTPAEKVETLLSTLAALGREWSREGRRLVLLRGPWPARNAAGEVVGVQALVKLYGEDGQEVPIDPHRVIVNPPASPDPVTAFEAALWDSVLLHPNPPGGAR